MSAVPGSFVGEEAARTKLLATLQAKCALLGAVLEASRDDRERPLYVITAGPVTLRLSDLAEVEHWITGAGR